MSLYIAAKRVVPRLLAFWYHTTTRCCLVCSGASSNLAWFVCAAVPVLVDGTRLDDLAKLYKLVARVQRLPKLKAAFAAHVKVRELAAALF